MRMPDRGDAGLSCGLPMMWAPENEDSSIEEDHQQLSP